MSYYIYHHLNSDTNNFYKVLIDYFKKININQESSMDNSNNNFDFIWCLFIDNFVIKKNINLLNCLINTDCITNKYLMYKNLENYFPNNNITPKCTLLTQYTVYDESKLFISRPTKNIKTKANATCGKDIIIIDSEEKLVESKKNLILYDNIVLTEYLKNPLLFQNRKFHFRCYMMYTIINNIHEYYMFDLFKIFTAKNNYIYSDFQNKNIHDTHYINRDYYFYYPKDFTTENLNMKITPDILLHINTSIQDICKKLGNILCNNIKLFSKSKNGFNIFGLDIMITNNFEVQLIECNYRPVIPIIERDANTCEFIDKLLNWILNIGIRPVFEPNYICTYKSLFTHFDKKFVLFGLDYNTYYNYLNFSQLKKHLVNYNLEEINYITNNTNIDFVWYKHFTCFDSGHTLKYLNMNINCINYIINKDCIIFKYNLFLNFKNLFPDSYKNFISDFFILQKDSIINFDKIYIAKPGINKITQKSAARCKDVIVFNNSSEYKNVKKLLNIYDNISICEYISNPLLFNNKKFILRTYMAFTNINKIFNVYVLEQSNILLSKKKFVNSSYNDNTIHTTRLIYQDRDLLFPDDMKNLIDDSNISKILNDIKNLCKHIGIIYLNKNSNNYNKISLPNHNNTFYIFGLDILIDTNYNPILLECNEFPSLGIFLNKNNMKNFHKTYFNWINDIVLTPIYNPKLSIMTTYSNQSILTTILN